MKDWAIQEFASCDLQFWYELIDNAIVYLAIIFVLIVFFTSKKPEKKE